LPAGIATFTEAASPFKINFFAVFPEDIIS